MAYKVIQWTTGFIGSLSLKYILANKNLELVGVKSWSAEKEGKDAGELVGMAPVGVKATSDIDALLATDADCVVFTPNDAAGTDTTVPGNALSHQHFETALRILESGKNIVSPLGPPTYYLHYQDPAEFIGKIELACAKGNSSIHYAGIDPGFFTDQFALNLAATSGIVNRIDTWEVLDYGALPYAEGLTALGFGCDPGSVSKEDKAKVTNNLWGGIPPLVARALGVRLEGTDIDIEYWLAPETFVSVGGLEIKKGTIAAYKFAFKSISGGQPFHVINHVSRMGPTAAPEWPMIGHEGGYRIVIDGSTPLSVDIPLGNPGGLNNACADSLAITAGLLVNRIPSVVQAAPGYRTFLDLQPLRPGCVIPGGVGG